MSWLPRPPPAPTRPAPQPVLVSDAARTVTVVVQGAPGRERAWGRSRTSIERSDIGTEYERLVHPEGLTGMQYFLSVLRRMAEAPTPLVLRLEDDALVNTYIRHNCGTWGAVRDARFGAGWLLTPGGVPILDYIYQRHADRSERWWDREHLHASVGVLLRTETIPALVGHIEAHPRPPNGRSIGQDMALSSAVYHAGKRIALHSPSLVEHPVGQSSLGHWAHPRHDTSNGTFRPAWRRP